jgi:two-component system response regulator YesN
VILLKNKIKMFLDSLIGKLFISYIMIIILVCLSSYFSYSFIYNILEERLVKDNRNEFNLIVNDCEQYLSDIKKFLLYIDMDKNFQNIISEKEISDFTIYKLSNYLENKYIEYPKYFDCWIYHKDSDYIVTALASYPKETFWRRLNNSQLYNDTFWREQLNAEFTFNIYFPVDFYEYTFKSFNVQNRYLTVMYKPANNYSYYLCAFVDMKKFLGSSNSIFSRSISMATNNDVGNKETNKPEGVYQLEYFSEKNNIYYYMDLDYRNIKEQMTGINTNFTLIMLASIIICLILSSFSSIKINAPLKNIVKAILPEWKNDENNFTSFLDLDIIQKHIYSLVQTNMKYKSETESKDMQLQSYALLHNIRNLYISEEISLNLKPKFPNGFYMVCIRIHLVNFINDNSTEKSHILYNCNHKINKYFSEYYSNSIYFSYNPEIFIVLLNIGNDEFSHHRNIIYRYLTNTQNSDVYFTLVTSDKQTNLHNLDSVYKHLLLLQQKRNVNKETQIIYETQIINENYHYQFDIDKMNDFSNHIMDGYIDESINIMKCVLKNNYRRNLNCFQFSMLCHEIINLCVKVIIEIYSYLPDEIDIMAAYSILKTPMCYENYVKICEEFVRKIENYINNTNANKGYIVDYILKYIEENYNKDIYLDLFAEKLNLSSVYISKHFKEKMGINFLDYLNKYRMEIACDKLKNSDLKIKDIANEVGIDNVNSFIRIFKKYYGKSPGRYRIYSTIFEQ